jgi:hypothetical protein
MHLRNFMSPVLFCWLLFATSLTSVVSGQEPVRIGIKGGLNTTAPVRTLTHAVMQGNGFGSANTGEKEYFGFFGPSSMGGQVGLLALIPFGQGFYLNVEALYNNYHFRYDTEYRWDDAVSNDALNLQQRHLQQISYIELPVLLRYDILPNAFSPFVQAGGFLGARIQANKQIVSRFLPESQLPANPEAGFSTTQDGNLNEVVLGWNAGLMGGAGFRYRVPRVEFGLGINYRMGMVQIADPSQRYSANNVWATNALDVLDDLFLHQLETSVYLIFPIGGSPANTGFGSTYCSFTSSKRRK